MRTVVQAGEVRSARIESLRAVAALAVLASHAYALPRLADPALYLTLQGRAFLGGAHGVMLFFAITGYLLFWPWAKGSSVDLRRYARNRVLRIVPLYVVAVAVLLLVSEGGGSLQQWARFMTLSENFFRDTIGTVNGPLWSIVVEVHFYLLLPLLAAALARLGRRAAGATLLGLGGASLALWWVKVGHPGGDDLLWRFSLPATFHWFVPGMLLALVRAEWEEHGVPTWLRGVAAGSTAWLLAAVPIWLIASQRFGRAPLVCAATFLALGACVLPLRGGIAVDLLETRALALVGVASYSLYVWHFPIVDLLHDHGVNESGALLVSSLLVCIPVALVSYRLIEAPFLRLRRRWSPAAAAATSDRSPIAAGRDSEPERQPRPSPQPAPGPSPRNARRILIGVLAVAMVLRVLVVVAQPHVVLAADAGDYARHAVSIAAGDGFPDTAYAAPGTPSALRPPAYPYLLGAVYAVSGDSVTVARLVGALLGTLAVLLVFLIARHVWGARTALVAAGLAAVAPPLVFTNASLVSEQLFVPLMLAIVLVLVYARSRAPAPSLGLAAAAGALCGLSGLTRVVGLALLVVVVVALSTGGLGSVRRRVLASAVAVLAALLVVVPWTLRNANSFDSFVPVSTQEGFNLFGTYNAVSAARDDPRANWHFPLLLPEAKPLFGRPGWDEARIDDELGSRARSYALDHPAYPFKVAFWNTLRLAGLTSQPLATVDYAQTGIPPRWRRAIELWVLAMLAGALAGVVLLRRRQAPRGPAYLWLTPIVLFVPVAAFLAVPRYRVPLDPFALMLCAVALVHLTGRRRVAR